MLRIRTGYSFRNAVGDIDDVLARLKEIGSEFAPITDRASTFAWAQWGKAAAKAGLKPVFGVELGVSPDRMAKKPVADHWVFLARDDIAPINKLVEIATSQFRYQPLLSVEQALAAAKDCNVIMGHRPQIDWSQKRKNVYLGLSPAMSRGLLKQALAHKWPLVATSDNRYPREEDRGFYEVLCGRNAETQTYAQHLLSPAEWRSELARLGLHAKDLRAAENNAYALLQQSTATLRRAALPTPKRPKGGLLSLCKLGAEKLGCDLSRPVYRERLKRELELIKQKGYEDYFYIVADLCQWARQAMIVGPARGSSCGSLVCYLLEITTIDPIPFGLIFERFVDINRSDMPDIDIDFSDQQRHLVFDYLSEKYGGEKVARLGVTTTYQPRSALEEVAKALRIPFWKTSAVADSLIERSSGDSRALQTLEDTLRTTAPGQRLLADHPESIIACRFEGHPRHYSQHAAGVVLAAEPISHYVAIDRRTGATMCDKVDAEGGYNLLKIDALGLTQLSVFEDTLEMAGLHRDHLLGLPLEDEGAFNVLNQKRYAGIFQFNGLALQNIASQFEIDKFDDIVSITALARPGPLVSGGAQQWVRRRTGAEPVTYPHPIFRPYLEDTLGIVLYQEQVMEIGRNVGDLGWGEVTALRKAMSKSLGREFFDQFGNPWKKAAIAKGVDAKAAEKIWDDLCAYGSWSFNKSHSVAYAYISYWCCWLKAHWPFEFAAASLTHERNPERQLLMLRELVAEGFNYRPVRKDSTAKWTIVEESGEKVLLGPLQIVDGIGPKTVVEILHARETGAAMPERAQKLLQNPTTKLDSLWPIRDAIRTLMPNPLDRNIVSSPVAIGHIRKERWDQDVMIFCTPVKIDVRDENEEINVVKRGGQRYETDTQSLNLKLKDDTGIIFAKIDRKQYEALGLPLVNRGRIGKALYAFKGVIRGHYGRTNNTFLGLQVEGWRYIGDMDEARKGKPNKAVRAVPGGNRKKLKAGEQAA